MSNLIALIGASAVALVANVLMRAFGSGGPTGFSPQMIGILTAVFFIFAFGGIRQFFASKEERK